MLNDMNSTDLSCNYYKQWIDVYKKDAIREATLAKYQMTHKWVEKLVSELKVSELTRTAYQQLLNDYAKEQRVFLAKIPKSDIKGKDGIEVGYSFSKKDVTEYSDTLNLVFYKNDITELGLSYMDYEADYGNPQYQIFLK